MLNQLAHPITCLDSHNCLLQYRHDREKIREKFVRPLQELSACMSLVAHSQHGGSVPPLQSSPILEISRIQDSFQKLRASLGSFSRYVPEQYILSRVQRHEEIGLSINTCHGSVLFSDIASFTTISESLEPQRLHQVRFWPRSLRAGWVGVFRESL
jgi:hypothetical protein